MVSRCSTLLLLALVGVDAINPPLKDVSSDKKFFGPPFPADYPEDTRPVVKKGILNKLKSPDQPYPKLQSKSTFDEDFVKDENSDKGTWAAQFEYDALRRKIAQEEGDEKKAGDSASEQARRTEAAQKAADAADKAANDAKKGVDDAAKGEEGANKADDAAVAPSKEALEEIKKDLKEAEQKYEEQKKAFAKCEQELKDAEAMVADLKQKTAAMEKKLAEETKLWAESKAVKFNLKKAKKDASAQATAEKIKVAADRLAAATKTKAGMDKALAKEKAEAEKAQKNFLKQKGEHDKAKTDLDKATKRLQQIHGFKPADAPMAKSGAAMMSAVGVAVLAAMQLF